MPTPSPETDPASVAPRREGAGGRAVAPFAARAEPGTAGTGTSPEGALTPEEVMARRAAAMLPPELLHGGEIIVLLLKPSPWYILLAPLQTLAALAVATLAAVFAAAHAPLDLARRDVVLLGAALIGLRLFWQLLEWLSRVYVLTDQRVIAVAGVIRIAVFQARHGQVQHTDLTFSLRERLFGLGTIGFATAGTASVEAVWRMIARPLETHQEVVRVIHRYRR